MDGSCGRRTSVNEDKSARYHRLKRRSAVLSGVASATLLAALLASGGSAALRDAAMSVTGAPAGDVATAVLFVLLLAVLQEAVALPIAFYRHFLLERRYDSVGGAGRGLAGRSCEGGRTGPRVRRGRRRGRGTWALEASPRWWWLISALVFMAAAAGLATIAPLVLLPIFYRFTPLAREALRARLVALSARAGVPVLGVYEWSLGDTTRRANAALVGTGMTRRIIISDTLLSQYSDDEIEVILAHELAHHVHHDIRDALAIECALLLAGFAAAAAALAIGWRPAGLASPQDVAGLPMLLIAGGAVMLLATPFVNARSRRHELRADRYALEVTRQPAAFISAMRRLAAQNLAESSPSRLTVWFFHTHPPIDQRIAAARGFQAGPGPAQ